MLICLTNSSMERYTIEQRVKIVEAFYENGRSNQNAFRALRDYFGQHNRPNVSTIGRIVRKFQQTGSVGNVKTPVLVRPVRSAENIAVVRDSLAEEPSTSTRRRAQQLNISRTSLMRILNKDLSSHAYKVDLKSTSGERARPTASVSQKTREFPPPGVRRSNKPPEKKQLAQKRTIYDEDDEYDSELDDFIDDGDENEDYSQHIKGIFGYDLSNCKDDDDDAAMDSTFAQQMREENVNKKIGLMEDLEDMRQEAEDKKRKAIMKKRKLN